MTMSSGGGGVMYGVLACCQIPQLGPAGPNSCLTQAPRMAPEAPTAAHAIWPATSRQRVAEQAEKPERESNLLTDSLTATCRNAPCQQCGAS
jgi:hypothetical protein